MDDAWCKVEIDFFKPTGYADTYLVHTDDRGLAVKTVMARYGTELKCLNFVCVNLVGPQTTDSKNRPILEIEPIDVD